MAVIHSLIVKQEVDDRSHDSLQKLYLSKSLNPREEHKVSICAFRKELKVIVRILYFLGEIW